MSVALQGNVRDFGIAEVFQLIGQQRKSGRLEFANEGDRIQVEFDAGRVVAAAPVGARPDVALGEMLARCGLLTQERIDQIQREAVASAQSLGRVGIAEGAFSEKDLRSIEDLLTRETIFAVLRWSRGSFDFMPGEVEHDREPDSLLGAEQILMDGLRMVDEWQSFADLVPSDDTVFRRIAGFEVYLQHSPGESRRQRDVAERVFFLVDGRLPVRRVVDLSLLGSFNATRILAELRRAGVIEPLGSDEARRLRQRHQPPSLPPSSIRAIVAGLVSIGLLATSATLAWRAPGAPSASGIAAVHPVPLQAAREAYALRRVRHALETFRLARGHWPASSAEFEDQRILGSDALAPSETRAYYYVNRGNGPLLLAPAR